MAGVTDSTAWRAGALTVLLTCAAAIASAPAAHAAAPKLDVVAAIQADGTSPFDADDAPGHDSGAANGIARTNDTVLVRLDWSVNRGAATGVVLSSTLPGGMTWTQVPAGCATPGSALADGGHTLRCELGDRPEGSSGAIFAPSQLTAATQGETLALTATLDASGTTPSTSPPVTVTASAAPSANLRANVFPGLYQPDIVRFVQDPGSGAVGVLVRWYVTLELPGAGRGAEGFAGDLTFVDRITGLSANTKLVDWESDIYGPGCSATVRLSPFVPFGRDLGSPLDNPLNTTRDSGAWTCAQAVPGGDIAVRVAGADWASAHFPTNAGYLLPLTGRKVVVSGYVTTWTPNTDLPGGVSVMTNALVGLDLDGVSGSPVTDSVPSDDTVSAVVTSTVGGTWESWIEAPYKELDYDDPFAGPGAHRDTRLRVLGAGAGNRFIATGSEVNYAGDSVSLPGDVVTMRMNTYTRTFTAPQPGRVMCAKVDPDAFEVIQTPPIRRDVPNLDPTSPTYFQTLSSTTVPAPPGAVVLHAFENVSDYTAQSTVEGPLAAPDWQAGVDYDVQYGYRDFSGPTKTAQLGQTTCDGGATENGVWYDDLGAADAAAGAAGRRVDMVRIVLNRAVTPRMNVVGWLSLRVRSGAVPGSYAGVYTGYGIFDPQPFPGTLPAAQWVMCKTPVTGCYDAATQPAAAQDWGDRTRVGDVTYAITHERVPPAGNPSLGEVRPLLAPGEETGYRVSGAVHGPPGSAATAANVQITVTVPAGERYVPGSSQGAPEPVVTDNPGGTQTLVYALGSVAVNTEVAITYRAQVRGGAVPFTTEPNVAVISGAQAFPQAAATRSATTFTAYSGPFGRLLLEMQTTTPAIEPGGEIRWSVPLGNRGPQDLDDPSMVTLVPFNGDGAIPGREGGSAFHGSVALAEVLAPPGSTVTYTAAPGAQIGRDRTGSLPAGERWCTEAQLGEPGCPASIAAATAFRVTGPALGAGAADRVVNVLLTTSGGQCDDVYRSDSSGGSSTLLLAAESNDVVTRAPSCRPLADPPQGPPASTPPDTPGPTPAGGSARLSIRKVASKRVVRAGRAIRYRITVRNSGTATARGVRVCDTPSDGLAVLKLPRGATLQSGAVCWKPFTLAAGARRTLSVVMAVYRSSAGTTVPNRASVSAQGVKAARAAAKVRSRPAARRRSRVTG